VNWANLASHGAVSSVVCIGGDTHFFGEVVINFGQRAARVRRRLFRCPVGTSATEWSWDYNYISGERGRWVWEFGWHTEINDSSAALNKGEPPHHL